MHRSLGPKSDRGGRPGLVLLGLGILALVAPAAAGASDSGAVVKLTTVKVGAAGNPSVAVVPFTDAVYRSCADAPQTEAGCQTVGGVGYHYGIGRLEITVGQWVAFLNTADPTGKNRRHLYDPAESSLSWPRYGQIDQSSGASRSQHYSVAYPEWTNKPYGAANFLRAARFVNALYNGRVLSVHDSKKGSVTVVTYKVELSRQTERGMYDLSRHEATRTHRSGFVLPSQNEWVKAAYYDRHGGGTFSYWKYPTNPGVFGDGGATAPSSTVLNPSNGNVTNASTQPLATYQATDSPAPTWCPAEVKPTVKCSTVNPLGLDPATYAANYQGSLSTVGQARTLSPWGTLDQGGNAVEWTDTTTPPPAGQGDGRVYRRLHGGIANAPYYQLWLSAVGLQPQDDAFFTRAYPWLGFRIGVLGNPKA